MDHFIPIVVILVIVHHLGGRGDRSAAVSIIGRFGLTNRVFGPRRRPKRPQSPQSLLLAHLELLHLPVDRLLGRANLFFDGAFLLLGELPRAVIL